MSLTFEQVRQAHATALQNLIDATDRIAFKLIGDADNPIQDVPPSELEQAVIAYKNSVWTAATSAADAGYVRSSTYAQDGWLLAGAWYIRLATISNKLNEALHAVPVATPPPWEDTVNTLANGNTRNEIRVTLDKFHDFMSTPLMGTTGRTGDFNGVQFGNVVGSQQEGSFAELMGKIMNSGTGGIADMWQSDASHSLNEQSPIMIVKMMGDRIINSAIALFNEYNNGTIENSTTRKETGDKSNKVLSSFASTLAFTMMGFGFTAAYLVPMTPFIIWVACVLGWTVMVVETIIAAPLWAIMHVHPDGEGLTGKAGNGYGLILTVILRPGLMIFGFVASGALMYPIGAFINQTFASVFQMSVGISANSPTSQHGASSMLTMLAGAFIYVGVMTTLVNKVFSLIHILPDQLLRWVGGQGDYFGKGMEQEALGGARAGIQQVSGAAQSGYQTAKMGQRDHVVPTPREMGDQIVAERETKKMGATMEGYLKEPGWAHATADDLGNRYKAEKAEHNSVGVSASPSAHQETPSAASKVSSGKEGTVAGSPAAAPPPDVHQASRTPAFWKKEVPAPSKDDQSTANKGD